MITTETIYATCNFNINPSTTTHPNRRQIAVQLVIGTWAHISVLIIIPYTSWTATEPTNKLLFLELITKIGIGIDEINRKPRILKDSIFISRHPWITIQLEPLNRFLLHLVAPASESALIDVDIFRVDDAHEISVHLCNYSEEKDFAIKSTVKETISWKINAISLKVNSCGGYTDGKTILGNLKDWQYRSDIRRVTWMGNDNNAPCC